MLIPKKVKHPAPVTSFRYGARVGKIREIIY